MAGRAPNASLTVARRSVLLGSARHLSLLVSGSSMHHLLGMVGALGEEDDDGT